MLIGPEADNIEADKIVTFGLLASPEADNTKARSGEADNLKAESGADSGG